MQGTHTLMEGQSNCSCEGKGVLRITLLTPLYVHVTEYFNCALTFHHAYGPGYLCVNRDEGLVLGKAHC